MHPITITVSHEIKKFYKVQIGNTCKAIYFSTLELEKMRSATPLGCDKYKSQSRQSKISRKV